MSLDLMDYRYNIFNEDQNMAEKSDEQKLPITNVDVNQIADSSTTATANNMMGPVNQEGITTESLLAPTPAELALANSPAERRGSGFLLLAAEAYEAAERTQMRADAIRQVAMELAAASTSGATSAGITDPILQQQYRDAILKSSASPFLQGLAGSSRSSSDAAALPPIAADSNFREQVYAAAANIQMRENSLEEAGKSEEGGKTTSKAKSSPKRASNNSTKRKRSQAASASKKQSPRKRGSDIPPLPPAPLVVPKKNHNAKVPPAKIFQDAKRPPSERTASGQRRVTVKHVYHDYAAIPDSEEFERKKTGGVAMPFPEKLMNMLDKASVLYPDVVSWCRHGRAFKVGKPKVFTNEVMGIYFKQSKLTSFQRQLNLYGFRRITQGKDAGAYYHELFLRGRPQLCMRMQRQKVKGTGIKQPTDVTTEPNFYDMPPVGAGTTIAAATAEEGSEVANAVTMEEVSVSVGGGAPMPSLFLLGDKSSSQAASTTAAAAAAPPFAPPDGEMIPLKSSFTLGATSQTNSSATPAMYEASPFTSEAATMLRRLSAPTVNAPPFGAPATTTLPCANANDAAAAITTLGNSKDDSTKMEEV